MKIFILGGTGFIGYHAALECVKRGHQVTALALPPLPERLSLPPQVAVEFGNIDALSDEVVVELLSGHDALIHAAGADDREVPRAPAYDFFYRVNVTSTQRLIKLACVAGVRQGIVLSSYFCHFERSWPELELSVHHPYIRARVQQAIEAFAIAADYGMHLNVLELPFIFGAMPGRSPLWAPLVNYVRSPLPLCCPSGGTNMIAITHVAEAIAGTLDRGEAGVTYTIGGENHRWITLLEMFCQVTGTSKKIRSLNSSVLHTALLGSELIQRLRGLEAGLKPSQLDRLLLRESFFDSRETRSILGYGENGLKQAIQDTVDACPI